MNGRVYRDGEVFQPSCKLQCRCLDGGFTCIPLCQEDVRLPTPDCPYPRRVEVPGKCCPEWICEARDRHLLRDAGAGKMQDMPVRGRPHRSLGMVPSPQTMNINRMMFPHHSGYACSTQRVAPTTLFPLISFHPARGAASPRLPYPCQEWGTEWSTCSATCGVGFSTRISNQNRYCRLETERRLCMARPCPALQAAPLAVSGGLGELGSPSNRFD